MPQSELQPHPPIADSDRYSRQILFPGIGVGGQQRLARAHAAIVGVGATGAAAASLLARAGVGRLTLIDRDIVEPSNLQRQVLFDEADAAAATPKAEAARAKIAQFNSAIQVEARIADLVPANIANLLADASLLLDCTDNFETRYLLNDYAVQQAKPWIYAGAIAAQAATMTILPTPARQDPRHSELGEEALSFDPSNTASACLACLFPTPPSGQTETCDTAGILGAAVNLAASLQTAEALKILTGQPELLRRTFLSIDLWSNQRAEIDASTPDPECEVCHHRRFKHLAGAARPHITLCGRNSVQIHEHRRPISLPDLQHRLLPHTDISDLRANALLLRFRRGPHQVTVFPDGRALIQGTTDPAVARSLYARFIGV
jgi:adenylyltransferase/sulfurtransferase